MDIKSFEDLYSVKLDRVLNSIRPGAGNWTQSTLAACFRFEINTAQRLGMFEANVLHESSLLTSFSENLNYSAQRLRVVFPKYFPNDEIATAYAWQPVKIANRVYANRMGNGPEASGDGYKYRGRGPLQWTGEDNLAYRVTGKEAYEVQTAEQGQPILDNPTLLELPGPGMFWAAWWWANHKLNQIADSGDFTKVVKVINGGTIGLDQRLKLYQKLQTALA